LQVKDLIDGRIIYARQKTEQPLDIKITPKIATILNLYIHGKEKSMFIFDIIKRIDIADQYKDVEWSRHRYNKKLKKLATLCEIEQNLTSYVSRHSFATRAKNLKVPIMGISEMLGHDNIKTTQIYLDSLPSDDMDDYHNQIIED
jgi:integrase